MIGGLNNKKKKVRRVEKFSKNKIRLKSNLNQLKFVRIELHLIPKLCWVF